MEKRLIGTLNIPEINSMFQFFDNIIDRALTEDDPDDLLIKSFFWFREHVNARIGSRENINRISEILYFQYIKKYLETNLEKELRFEPIRKSNQSKTFYFRADLKGKQGKVILTSGTTCRELGIEFLPPNLNKKEKKADPDIVISITYDDEKYHPIAIFEIKNLLKKDQLAKEITRFNHFKTQLLDDPYLILICLHYKTCSDLDFIPFKEISENKCKLIKNQYQWDGGIKGKEEFFKNNIDGSIKDIMIKIREDIEKLI